MDKEEIIRRLKKISRHAVHVVGEPPFIMSLDDGMALDYAVRLLEEQESVAAHWSDDTGHWIEGDRNGTDPSKRTTGEMIDTFRCSWCGFYQYWKTPYCPNCGTKMEGR